MRAAIQIRTCNTRHTQDDVDLENRIAVFLHQRRVPDGNQVRADARGGTVVVSGQLRTSREKWLCLATCQRVAGVVRLVDRLVVESATPEDEQQSELLRAA